MASVMLSEMTADGVWLMFMNGDVCFGYCNDNEKAKHAADELKRRYKEGQPITIQGVEFRKTPQGIRIDDKKNTMGQIAGAWDKTFDELFDLDEFNKEGFDRLMTLVDNKVSKDEIDRIYDEELAIAMKNKKEYEENKKNQKPSFWRKLFGH